MYFNKKNNFFHGIMFHHFHDKNIHKKGQGSIDKDDFYKIINFIGRNNILSAEIFFEKFKSKKLKKREVCLTFDDALKCQIDIALPILEELRIKSFFFVQSSIFGKNPDLLEVFRYFRMNSYNNVNDFYSDFFMHLDTDLEKFFKKYDEYIKNKLRRFKFYSEKDIKFRLVRDLYLSRANYFKIMKRLMKKKKFKFKNIIKKVYFSKKDIIKLNDLGHLIGLHSHTHPNLIEKLSFNKQKEEYEKSQSIISKILNKEKNFIKFMSHPNGSYNENSLKILKKINIQLGFKQIMYIEPEKRMKKINNSFLEIARNDHSNILKIINS